MTQDVATGFDGFVGQAEPFRRELLAHCYRMLGSLDDAEDVVQETYLRAWRSYDGFEGRSSVRVWLHRIATNACLTAAEQRGRRPMPSGLGGPSDDPDGRPAEAPDLPWLHAVPDELVTPDSQDPAVVAATRDSVRLALIAGLQELPARQRAVLLLREVLEIPATEVAVMLDTSVPAVKSALQRARARIAEVAPTPAGLVEPADPVARSLLDQYVAGFENADLAVLERALRADAAIEMIGSTTWFSGRDTCLRYLARVLGAPGDWRMVRTSANGQPAAAAYLRGADGVRRAFGLGVLTATSTGISRIVVFAGGADLLARFGQPADLGV
jgi:RNA polymerase sigma-70 factor, ECF subfamily